jgi:glycosyltransferase involved in cell wall biosynthesis
MFWCILSFCYEHYLYGSEGDVIVKITFVLPPFSNYRSGGFKVVYEYANHLVRKGNEVTIIYLWTREIQRYLWSQELERSGSGRPLPTLFLWLRQYLGLLAYNIQKPKLSWYRLHSSIKLVKLNSLEADRVPDADAIFATAWQTASYVNECPREKGAKFYLVMDFAPWLGDKHELEQTWRLPLKKIAISNWLAELVLQAGVPKEDVEVISIAIDHDCFHIINNIRRRAKRVIMLYSLSAYKRSQLGLAILLKCKDAVSDLEASLFGPLKKRPAELPSWIEYYGDVTESELRRLYNAASIYLCSSAAEGFALPPAEAMACGCAVATTDCGGNRDYAEHEKTALVSDPNDFVSLEKNVLQLLSDEELRVRIAFAGSYQIAQFTWEKSTQQLIKYVNLHS